MPIKLNPHRTFAVNENKGNYMKISVVCPVYNTQPEILNTAIDSIKKQTGQHTIEVIIVDDGSTLEATISTLGTMESCCSNIKIIRSENYGPAHARNLGIKNSSYDWIGFIDADDIWPEDKLRLHEGVLNVHPNASWIIGNCEILKENSQIESPSLSAIISAGIVSSVSKRFTSPDTTKALIYHSRHLGTCIIKKGTLIDIGGFNEALKYGEDWLLFLKLSTKTDIEYIEKVTYILRRQGRKSMMHSGGRLSSKYILSSKLAQKEQCLLFIKRELKWYRYVQIKEVAMNNLLNKKPFKALYFSIKAWLGSPTDLKELLFFINVLSTKNKSTAKVLLGKYCSAEQVDLN